MCGCKTKLVLVIGYHAIVVCLFSGELIKFTGLCLQTSKILPLSLSFCALVTFTTSAVDVFFFNKS